MTEIADLFYAAEPNATDNQNLSACYIGAVGAVRAGTAVVKVVGSAGPAVGDRGIKE